jgi:hypothetical protein
MRIIYIGLFAVLCACSTETGLLVKTSKSEAAPTPDRLVFYVAEKYLGPGHFGDTEPLEDVGVAERDLLEEPYKLILRPGGYQEDGTMVVALGYQGDRLVAFGQTPMMRFLPDKVAEWDLVLEAAGHDVAVDENHCLEWLNGGEWFHIGRPGDLDCDGFVGEADCNGLTDAEDERDVDQDLVTNCGGDCDDSNDQVYPGAPESCDGADNDCNGICDDGFDEDGDTVTICGSVVAGGLCGDALIDVDCDDLDPERSPLKAEECDGIDNDCSGLCDDDAALDGDGDSYTVCGSIVGVCGLYDAWKDCAPDVADVNPGALEVCDGKDNNCDGALATSVPCFDATGECQPGTMTCDESGSTPVMSNCAGTAGAAAPGELCTLYDGCAATDSATAWECFDSGLDQQMPTSNCTVHFSDGGMCPGKSVGFPEVGTTCSSVILGGSPQMGYDITLSAGGEPTTSGVCGPVLTVNTAVPLGTTDVLIFSVVDGVGEMLRVRLTPKPVETCSVPGLVCDNLQTVP